MYMNGWSWGALTYNKSIIATDTTTTFGTGVTTIANSSTCV